MVPYYGDFAEDDTVLIPFNTFSSDDPSASVTITDLADADIKVHKDGGTTEIATDGASVAIDFDSRTGAHLITIDTSAHSDYATGSEYAVLIEGTTVDGATITAWVGAFSIERAGGALALLKNASYGLDQLVRSTTPANTLDVSATGEAGLDFDNIKDASGAHTLTNITVPTVTTNSDMRGTDSAALASVCTETRLAELDAANLPSDVDDILTDTAEIGAAGAGLTAVPWNANWDAEVESECNDALVANNLDHLMKTAVSNRDTMPEVVDDTVLANIMTKTDGDTSDFDHATDSLEALRDHIGDGTNLTEAGGDGDHLTEAGSDGDHLTAVPWNAAWDTEVQSECHDALNAAISSPTASSLLYYMQKMFTALVNKTIITEANGNTEQFDDADSTLGSIAAAFSSDGTYTTRKRMVI